MTSTQGAARNSTQPQGCIPLRFNATQYLPWDSPHNLVSQRAEYIAGEVRDLTLGFLFLIGGPTNLVNMAVFYRQGLRERINLCLFVLSATDELYLISCLFAHGENIYLHLAGRTLQTEVNLFMANHNLLSLLAAGHVSYFLSAIIACERCYCVLRPLKYQTVMSVRAMGLVILSVYAVVFGFFFVVSYRYRYQCFHDPVTGKTSLALAGGGIYTTHKYFIDTLDGVVFGAIIPGGIMTVVTVSTIITALQLHHIVTWRAESSSSSSSSSSAFAFSARELSLTKMLIGNSLFFLACITPNCVFHVAYLVLPGMTGGGVYHNFFLLTMWLVQSTTFVNCSLNFFIYFSMGTRYRETCRALFSRKSPLPKDQT